MLLVPFLGIGAALAEPSAALAAADPAPTATDPPPAPAATPAAPDPTVQALEARIAALEEAARKAEEDQLLRDAEALAAPPGPAPTPPPARPSFNALNPGITAFGDLVGQLGVGPDGVMAGSTVYLRSLELELRADVDPFAKADVVIAWEQEAPPLEGGPGEGFGSEPEEVYVDLVALPARLSARVGKFRVPFGIVNRTHPHDLPWIDPPELAGEEGYNDTGATLSWLVPLGSAGLTLTAGGFSGTPFDEDGARANVAGLGRAELFVGTGSLAASIGGSIVGDIGGDHASTGAAGVPLVGGDATIRWKPGQRRSLVLMGEVVQVDLPEAEEDAEGTEGDAVAMLPGPSLRGYAAVQVQPARMVYLGVRQDFGDEGLRTGAYVSFYTSEFLRARIGAGYTPADGTVDALAQLTFVWGSHPVEPWWVNR